MKYISKNHPFATVRNLQAFTTIDGNQTIVLTMSDGHRAFVPPTEFGHQGAAAFKTLAAFNITPLVDVRADIMKRVGEIDDWPAGPFIASSGDVEPYFAMRDGSVFGPKEEPPVEAIFPRDVKRFGQSGTLKAWQKAVVMPLLENPLPCFFLMLPFVGPLLSMLGMTGNVGFQLVGGPALGKTTLLLVSASAIGSVSAGDRYIVSFIATSNGLETILPQCQDMLFLLEEGQLFNGGDTARSRSRKWSEFVFRFSDGSSKLRGAVGDDAGGRQIRTRFVFAYSANVPLSEAIGGVETDEEKAVLQRIFELPATRRFGVFDVLPEGVVGATALSASTARNICSDMPMRTTAATWSTCRCGG